MPKSIVILDANNVIANGGLDVLVRHANYASSLKTISKQNFQLVLIGTKELQDQKERLREKVGSDLIVYVIKESKFKRIFFWKRACRVLRENRISPTLLVAGDPWVSGCHTILVKKFLKGSPKIQIQLHADLFAPGWRQSSIINYIKFQVARKVILRADYIRTVSSHQTNNLSPYLKKDQIVSCIPVPLTGYARVKQVYSKDFKTFGFFGRLQSDRGTKFVIDKFALLLRAHSEIRLVIAGSGSDEKLIINKLKKQFPNQVIMFGHLSTSQLQKFWNQVDVLLSVAEYESYGRAPREAILNLVPVLATPSSGILDLIESPMSEWVSLVSRDIDPEDLLNQGRKIFRKVQLLPNSDFELDLQDSVHELVMNWIEILS